MNEFLANAQANSTGSQARTLNRSGLLQLSGRNIEVERLGYSNISSFGAGKGADATKGLQLAIDQMHSTNPYILIPGRGVMRYEDAAKLGLDPEEISTFGYQSVRKSTATVMRYRYYDETRKAYVYITKRDIESLRVGLSGGVYNPAKLAKVLDIESFTNRMEMLRRYDPLGKMGALNQKIAKRESASVGERRFVNNNVEDLLDNIKAKIKTNNPELYTRMENAGILPQSLDDVFMFTKTSDMRLLDAVYSGDKTILNNIADEARIAMENFEAGISAAGKSLGSLADDEKKVYASLVDKYRKSQMNLLRMQGFGQREADVSRQTLVSNFTYYGRTEEELNEVLGVVKEAFEASGDKGNFSMDEAFKYMEAQGLFGEGEEFQKFVFFRQIAGTDSFEKAYDGSMVIDQYVMRHAKDFLTGKNNEFDALLTQYKALLDSNDITGANSLWQTAFAEEGKIEGETHRLQKLLADYKYYLNQGNTAEVQSITETVMKINPFEEVPTELLSDQVESAIKLRIAEMQKVSKLIADPLSFTDVETTRILLGEGLGKAVADIEDLRKMLSMGLDAEGNPIFLGAEHFGYIGYGSQELLKNETLFARFLGIYEGQTVRSGQAITMDPMHHGGAERVMADVQANIFHSEFFQDQETLKMIRHNMDQVNQEIDAMINTGVVSKKLITRFQQQAGLDVEAWEALGFESRGVAERFRSSAQEVLNFLMSGGRPDEIPSFANKIIRQAAKDVFRTVTKRQGQSKIYQPVLPFATRQAVDTEGVVSERGSQEGHRAVKKIINGVQHQGDLLEDNIRLIGENAYKDVTVNLAENDKRNLRLLRYRNDGHKFIVPDIAAMGREGGLYTAGGGFDLDDKFIQNLSYVVDAQGKKRLTSFVFRQPTGAQEYALMAPSLDRKTLTRLMGSEDFQGRQFRAALADYGTDISKRTGVGASSENFKTGRFLEDVRNMSEEDRVIKYLENVSRGNHAVADIYYGGRKIWNI